MWCLVRKDIRVDIKSYVGVFIFILLYLPLITVALADEYQCSVVWSSGTLRAASGKATLHHRCRKNSLRANREINNSWTVLTGGNIRHEF